MNRLFSILQNAFRFRKIYSRIIILFTLKNYFNKKQTVRKALIVYSNEFFILGETYNQIINYRSYLIAKMLDKYGYEVDIFDYRNPLIYYFKNPLKNKIYDLIIYHGKLFHKKINSKNLNNAYLVYLSTGVQPDVQNMKIQQRINYLIKRKNLKDNIKIESGFEQKELNHMLSSDIILTGETRRVEELQKKFNKKIFSWNQFPFLNLKPKKRNINSTKINFLYYSSGKQIAKGLDLLLDIFYKNKNMNLYISSFYENEKKFLKIYNEEIFNSSNIYPCGFNNVNSKKFDELISKCLFVICPTSTEGQPGSIINCMSTGMIPIVTDDCNFINIKEYGFEIKPNIQNIEEVIQNINLLTNETLQVLSNKSIKNTKDHYSVENFNDNLSRMLKYIIQNPK